MQDPGDEAQAPIELENTQWRFQAFDEGGERIEALTGVESFIKFDEGQATGSAGCNSYFGAYKLEKAQITFDAMGSTMMACEDAAMHQENRFLAALEQASRVELNDDILVIQYSENGSLIFIWSPDAE